MVDVTVVQAMWIVSRYRVTAPAIAIAALLSWISAAVPGIHLFATQLVSSCFFIVVVCT